MDVTVSDNPKKIYTADEYFNEIPETNLHIELINGEIVHYGSHGTVHQQMLGDISLELLHFVKAKKNGSRVFILPFDVKLDDYNVVQPDVLVVCDKNKLDGKRCNGAPDLVIEIVEMIYPTRNADFFQKLAMYSRFGVREYWIVDPKNEKTLVYFWDETEFPEIYPFDKPIPVRIFNSELAINISDLIL